MTPLTEPPKTDLPAVTVLLNSSALKLTNCRARYNNRVVRGLTPVEQAEPLGFGKAVHKFAQARNLGRSQNIAMQEVFEYYSGKDGEKLALACAHMPAEVDAPYTEPNGLRYVELKFKVYWKSMIYGGVMYHIYVVGTFDKVSVFSDGVVRITDYKTTRKWKFAEVFADYRVSVQMYYYLWAAQRFGYSIFDMTVANACHDCRVQLNICGVFLSAPTPVWKYGPAIQVTLGALDEFEALLNEMIERVILPSYVSPSCDGRVNDTCRGCEYVPLCFAENDAQLSQAEAFFKTETYNPALW